ncbi:hypothetical protein THUN1379_26010 [Paludibacterium sp. THUN1379]|nr:hypothetical protein THUN1379_26010 [Paludibacterium sp. THUN1379]
MTLIEMLLVMALMSAMYAMAGQVLARLSGQVRLEASALHVWSVLGLARSEALYSNQPVHVCALLMRRNSRLNSCRAQHGAEGEAETLRDGLLVFADWPSAGSLDRQRPALLGQYDAREDLRDGQVLAGIRLSGHQQMVSVQPTGRYQGGQPCLQLSDPRSAGSQMIMVTSGLGLPQWLPGQSCAR